MSAAQTDAQRLLDKNEKPEEEEFQQPLRANNGPCIQGGNVGLPQNDDEDNVTFGCLRATVNAGLHHGLTVLWRSGTLQTDERVEPAQYNGLIGSAVLLLFLISVTFCQEIATYASDQERYVSQSFNIFYICLGFLALLWFWCKRKEIVVANPDNHDHDEDIRDIEPYFAMWLFWGFSVCLDVISVWAVMDCMGAWKFCGWDLFNQFSVDVAYHIMRPIYMFCQGMFCIFYSYSRTVFKDVCGLRYGLVIMLAAMLSIWGELLLDESAERSHLPKENLTIKCHYSNVSNHTAECLKQETPMFQNLEIIMPICFPSMIEFALLVGECILHWFFGCQYVPPAAPADVIQGNSCCGDFLELFRNIKQHLREWCQSISKPACFAWTSVSLIFSMSLGVPYIILAITARTTSSMNIFLSYSIAFWTVSIAVVSFGYCLTIAFVPERKAFSGLDFLILLALLGPIMYQVFSIGAIVHIWLRVSEEDLHAKYLDAPYMYFITEILNTLQLLFQVPLLYHSRRLCTGTQAPQQDADVAPPGHHQQHGAEVAPLDHHRQHGVEAALPNHHRQHDAAGAQPVRRSRKFSNWARLVFIAIIFHLTFSNFINWGIDNFVAPTNTGLSLHSIYYYDRDWMLVSNFITPLIIFFRFHNMLLFFKVWRRLSQQQFDVNTVN